ncbi:nuclear transport factor 2 family protein [Streptomyces sp. NRRL F-5123]|uniref:nuclear transport factor 2 family protein n=1 Tax=Streptomyces sp. NRRL F-5123 TaxID=1463856 RepID=UPI0004E0F6FE|nr:nuclear transport factor 2 family protein [Streptomyces sp. NRRL F-5123]
MATAERFRAAVENRDLSALDDLFTDDIRFYSPVKFRPFEGRRLVTGLFGVLYRTFEDVQYGGRLDGAAERGADGARATATALPFQATVKGRQIHGIDLLHFDGARRITEITVLIRPQSAVQIVAVAIHAGLLADGLLPAPVPAER